MQVEDNCISAVADPPEGAVPAHSAVPVTITLCLLAPGESTVKCKVSIAGLDTPFELPVHACASGPKLKIEPKELYWAQVSRYSKAGSWHSSVRTLVVLPH